MAADQLNKRSKGSNVIGQTTWEQQKAKKKKFIHCDLNVRARISLEWDDKKKTVVSKREQIGIAHRELTPFLSSIPHGQNILGDVFSAPPEIFELDNLTDLLSYEVWKTHLSEQERSFLTQFLPERAETHKVVRELLDGNNIHFGNPLLKWGASLCSGDCHPDAVIRRERCKKANKAAYQAELQKYHTKMVGSLQIWKERWARCKNSENDFMQKILRSRKDVDKSGSSHVNDILRGPEDYLGDTSDSCSWDADDKVFCSDSQDTTRMHGETLKRISRKDLKSKYYDSSDGQRSVTRKGENLDKRNIECGDGARYMSYIKVSKEQHQRVKSSMNHSSNSIQHKSLNHVLGNLDTLCVRPFEVFEEEERQRLHDHWLHLVKKDLPAGFENWNKLQSAKRQLTKSLRQELIEKSKSNDPLVLNLHDQDKVIEKNHVRPLHGQDNGISDTVLIDTSEYEDRAESSSSLQHEQLDDGETDQEPLITSESEAVPEAAIDDRVMQIEHRDESGYHPAHNHLQEIALLNGNQNLCPPAINSNIVLPKSPVFPCNLGEYGESMSHGGVGVGERDPLSSATTNEIWSAVGIPSAYYNHQSNPMSHGYGCTSGLSLGHPNLQPSQMIGLESEIQRHDTRRGGFLNDSLYNPYDRSELLINSLFKNPVTSYHNEQQQQQKHQAARLGFHHPVSGSDVYMHQETIYGSGRQEEELLPLNQVSEWTSVNGSVDMSTSSHPQLNSVGLMTQNWLSGEQHRARDVWSTASAAGGDQGLYSVLSGVHFDSNGMGGGTQGFIPSGNYGGGGAMPMPMSMPRTTTQLDYLNANEAQVGVGVRTNISSSNSSSLGWMSLPPPLQNGGSGGGGSGLPEKLFSRSWNHLA